MAGRRMLASQRQSMIVDYVRTHGDARVAGLVELLSVSDMTVRRDLDVLASRGLLKKVHGGATLADRPSPEEPGFRAKSLREHREKQAIARVAATMVRPGSAIAVSAGTTTWELARHLVNSPDLTVVTNSVAVAAALNDAPGDRTLVLTGGVRTPSDALVGPLADMVIRSLHFDVLFLGCHGMDARAGLSTPNLAEAQTNRTLIRSAREVVVMADHTKWGTVGLSSFADLSEVNVLITDAGLDVSARAVLQEAVGRVVIAEVDRIDHAPDVSEQVAR
jgi:DeoR/GlpR family transcriptional regulator of sugar metabolism